MDIRIGVLKDEWRGDPVYCTPSACFDLRNTYRVFHRDKPGRIIAEFYGDNAKEMAERFCYLFGEHTKASVSNVRQGSAVATELMTGRSLGVGSLLNINDECIGRITAEDGERFYIDSDCFRGWATKAEIVEAIQSATGELCPDTQQQPHSVVA
jgi:hypothetical protein